MNSDVMVYTLYTIELSMCVYAYVRAYLYVCVCV